MVVFPKSKINLGLNITGKRPDGYHDIETVFYPLNFCDALEFVPSTEGSACDSFTITGIELPGNTEDNLIFKALRILRKKYPIPYLRIHLHKSIPVGAGLGGGSSDAACMLRSLNKTFNLLLGSNELQEYAASLGSDSPFFINCQPSFASGRGEILKPVTIFLNGMHIVLVNPGINISTREAYGNCVPSVPEKSLYETIRFPVSKWKESIFNDFEKTIFVSHPEIRSMKQAMYDSGALYSSMSGSGSTVYGIFHEKPSIPGELREYVIYEGVL